MSKMKLIKEVMKRAYKYGDMWCIEVSSECGSIALCCDKDRCVEMCIEAWPQP
mgnify:CR=1 FL=1